MENNLTSTTHRGRGRGERPIANPVDLSPNRLRPRRRICLEAWRDRGSARSSPHCSRAARTGGTCVIKGWDEHGLESPPITSGALGFLSLTPRKETGHGRQVRNRRTDATWNPVTGCTKVTRGCDNCYAERLAERFRDTPGHPFERGFDLTLRPERLSQPLSWKRPRKIFVNSMSDLFPRKFLQNSLIASSMSWRKPTVTFSKY